LKLIVGLGNPGPEYSDTRHNVGFLIVDALARRHEVALRRQAKWKARTAKVGGIGGGMLLAAPTTFMNLSGWAVREIAGFHKLEPADLLVVVDDADLPVGKLRLRPGGSAGGHNGLKSVIERLGTTEFSRLRLGVGRGDGRRDLADHVLARFERGEQADLGTLITRAADAAEMFAAEGISKVMNEYNPDAAASDVD
jgi:PTH1 family peptidyl-tRNA hydrolase